MAAFPLGGCTGIVAYNRHDLAQIGRVGLCDGAGMRVARAVIGGL